MTLGLYLSVHWWPNVSQGTVRRRSVGFSKVISKMASSVHNKTHSEQVLYLRLRLLLCMYMQSDMNRCHIPRMCTHTWQIKVILIVKPCLYRFISVTSKLKNKPFKIDLHREQRTREPLCVRLIQLHPFPRKNIEDHCHLYCVLSKVHISVNSILCIQPIL